MAEVRVELLLGRAVRARNGRVVGRIEEIIAEEGSAGWEITEYHIGTAALLERLSMGALRIAGIRRARGYRVRWDQLAVDEGAAPHLTCTVDELEPFE